MKDIEIYKQKLQEKQNYILEKKKEINQWETIRKEKEINKENFGIENKEENEANILDFQCDDTTLEFIKKQRNEQDIKDKHYFEAAEGEIMEEEENRMIISSNGAKVNESKSFKNLTMKDLDQLVTVPSEQYQLAVSSLHDNAIQMKECVDTTMKTLSEAGKNQTSLYHTFKMVQFSSYGKGIVAPMEAFHKELSSKDQEN